MVSKWVTVQWESRMGVEFQSHGQERGQSHHGDSSGARQHVLVTGQREGRRACSAQSDYSTWRSSRLSAVGEDTRGVVCLISVYVQYSRSEQLLVSEMRIRP